uniref:Uncharacterized protein n=1 Tax=Steinernema glaseri TaxID=37863 RepID=A0A1I8A5L9_9BILA
MDRVKPPLPYPHDCISLSFIPRIVLVLERTSSGRRGEKKCQDNDRQCNYSETEGAIGCTLAAINRLFSTCQSIKFIARQENFGRACWDRNPAPTPRRNPFYARHNPVCSNESKKSGPEAWRSSRAIDDKWIMVRVGTQPATERPGAHCKRTKQMGPRRFRLVNFGLMRLRVCGQNRTWRKGKLGRLVAGHRNGMSEEEVVRGPGQAKPVSQAGRLLWVGSDRYVQLNWVKKFEIKGIYEDRSREDECSTASYERCEPL